MARSSSYTPRTKPYWRAAPTASGRRYADYLASRPTESETAAVARLVDLAERTGARTHVVHVSSGDAADLIAAATDAAC